MNKIQIVSEDGCRPKVLVDNNKIDKVVGLNFSCASDEVPILTIKTESIPEFLLNARVVIDPNPGNIQCACNVLSRELKKHGDFYKGFLECVKSAIHEAPSDIYISELAEKIVKRISGEE